MTSLEGKEEGIMLPELEKWKKDCPTGALSTVPGHCLTQSREESGEQKYPARLLPASLHTSSSWQNPPAARWHGVLGFAVYNVQDTEQGSEK